MSAQVFPPGSDDTAFERAVEYVLKPGHEGDELSQIPGDPGGLTRFGLSQRQYPALDLSKITRDQARALYRRDYWDRFGFGLLPATLACHVLDFGVNHGPEDAIRFMQRALRACGIQVSDDGVIGIQTKAAFVSADERIVIAAFQGMRDSFYRSLALHRPEEAGALHDWVWRTWDRPSAMIAAMPAPAAPSPAESQAHG